MSYTKNYPVWNSGTCCGTSAPGPVTPITVAVLNNYEQALFDAHNMEAALASDAQQTSKVAGDADFRYFQGADGTLAWGDGTNPLDVVLLRGGPNILQTQDEFRNVRAAATDSTYVSIVSGDTQLRYRQSADGTMEWGDGTNPADVKLYRSAANVLRTEDQFSIYRVGQAANAELRLSADAGFMSNIRFRTGTLDRWGFQTDGAAEGGANAGTNLQVARFDDAGVQIGTTVMTFNRATGVAAIQNPGLANGAIVSVDGTQPLSNKTYAGFGATPTTINMTQRVTGDTQVRWSIDASGTQFWSPGSGAPDVGFGRLGPGQLQANGEFRSFRGNVANVAFSSLITGDTVTRWQITAGGTESWGPGGATAHDVTWSRTAAGALALSAVGITALMDIRTGAASTNSTLRFSVGSVPRWEIGKNATVEPGGGTQAGSDFEIRAISDNGLATNATITITRANGNVVLPGSLRINGNVGFYNTAPVAKPTVTGSRGGNAALASLLTALAGQGLITDSSSA